MIQEIKQTIKLAEKSYTLKKIIAELNIVLMAVSIFLINTSLFQFY